MAYQMVYTSIKSGLVAGRSGFCTAARHKEIREALVGRIEDLSGQYERGSSATGTGGGLPVIYSHHVVAVRETVYHVLMRLADAGNDYSGRTNHIAHSIVVDPSEFSRIRVTPGEAILQLIRNGTWRSRYEEAARYFGPEEEIDLSAFVPSVSLPAGTWATATGAAANAARLLDPRAATGAGVVPMEGNDVELLLKLFAESALLESPDRSGAPRLWSRSFTTLLQSAKQRTEFDWHGCVYNSPVHLQAVKSDRYLVELVPNLAPPSGRFADIAEGRPVRDEPEPKGPAPARGSSIDSPTATVASVVASPPPAPGSTSIELPSNMSMPTAELTGGELRRGHARSSRQGSSPLLFAGVGVGILAALVLVVMLLFSGGPAKKAERQLGEMLGSGEWEKAAAFLGEEGTAASLPQENRLTVEERKEFESESEPFQNYAELVDEYRVLVAACDFAAKRVEEFLAENDIGKSPDPVGKLDQRLGDWKKSVDEAGISDATPGRLSVLRDAAESAINGYLDARKEVDEAWSDLVGLNDTGFDGGAIRDRIGPPRSEAPDLLLQVDYLTGVPEMGVNGVIPVVRSYRELKAKYESEEDFQAAKKRKDELTGKLEADVGRAGETKWAAQIREIRKNIADYTPVRVEKPKGEGTDDSGSMKNKDKEEETTEAVDPSRLPTTYVLPIVEGDYVFSYAGIEELAEGIGRPLGIVPALTLESVPRAHSEGNFIGSTQPPNIYSSDSLPAFTVNEGAKTIQATDRFKSQIANGFTVSFGPEGNSVPDFQIIGQVPSSSPAEAISSNRPYLLHLSPDEGLVKSSGETLFLALSETAGEKLASFRFTGTEVQYQLVMGDGSSPPTLSQAPSGLRKDLSSGFDEEITRRGREIANYEALRDVSTSFQTAFKDLGARLFRDGSGKRILYPELAVKTQRNEKKIWFDIVPSADKTKEADGLELIPTLEEYVDTRIVEGPALIHYMSEHLYDVLLQHGRPSNKLTPDAKNILDEKFRSLEDPENATPEAISEVLQRWRELRKIVEDRKLAEMPELPTRLESQEEAEKTKRRIMYYMQDRYVAEFFTRWKEIFTDENIAIAERMLLGGGGGAFSESVLEEMKSALEEAKKRRENVGQMPLSELGTFHVNAVVTGGYPTDPNRTFVYRLLRIGTPSPTP